MPKTSPLYKNDPLSTPKLYDDTIFSHKLNLGSVLTNTGENQAYFLDLIDSLPSGIMTFDSDGIISLANNNAISYLKIKDVKITNTHIFQVFKKGRIKRAIEKSMLDNMSPFIKPYVKIDNRRYQILGKPFNDGMLISIQDITDNNKIKDDATKSLLQGQEMERGRISREMHDGLGPLLSSIKLRLDNVRNKVSDENAVNALIHIDGMISDTAKEIRSISHALMPSSLKDFGLEAALSNLLKNITKPGLEFGFDYAVDSPNIQGELALHIYRIIQELINNSLKHSEAEWISIQVANQSEFLSLNYKDNGLGYDVSTTTYGLGINNIKNRVQILGGGIDIQSKQGKGVEVEIKLPLND